MVEMYEYILYVYAGIHERFNEYIVVYPSLLPLLSIPLKLNFGSDSR